MRVSIRTRFILISVSITVFALSLFTSAIYERSVKYKHEQEVQAHRILAEQFYKLVHELDDINLIKQTIKDNITTKSQPAEVIAILNKQRDVKSVFSKHINLDDKKLIQKVKASFELKESQLKVNDRLYYWFISDLTEQSKSNYSLLTVYPLSSFSFSEFTQYYGLPFYISGFLMCWMMVWASIILASFVTKLEKQKQTLSVQTIDIEKKADEALSASSAKSDFLANMSHEIRTPLTSIIGFAESNLDINQSGKERLKSTKTIIKNGKHLMYIINELLDLSKVEAGKLELENSPYSITSMLADIDQLVSVMVEDKGITFEINYIYPLPKTINSDQLRLKQVLLNLCSNAIKFTNEGSVELIVSYDEASSNLIFEVVDTGLGLTKEQQVRIFKPYEQARNSSINKYNGTGLGLTLSTNLINLLNGELTVESEVDVGSRFTAKIEIDKVDSSNYIYENDYVEPEDNEGDNKALIALQGNILIAEDDPDIQCLVEIIFKRVEITPDFVNNGQLALEQTVTKNYDLIFMDMEMPVMDGLTAMNKLKQQNYSVPVVAMTANAMQKDRDKCKEAGFSDFVSKPIDRKYLYSLLKKYLKPAPIAEIEDTVITSNLLIDDPSLIDLIDKFMARLPVMQKTINSAYNAKNNEELSAVIHQLKGVGGGYGYPMLTDLCAKIEFQVTANERENIAALIDELNLMANKILNGSDENHKIVAEAES